MIFNQLYVPAKGRAKYGNYSAATTTVKSTGGGGGGGTSQSDYLNAYTTLTGDTAGQWTVTGSVITTLRDGMTIKVKLSTDHSNSYNTLDIGAAMADTTGTTFLVWEKYNEPLKSDYGLNDELMLTFRTDAGSYTIPNDNGAFTAGTVVTNGWIIESAVNFWEYTATTALTAITTEYNVMSSGDVCSHNAQAITGITGLTVVDDLSGGTTAHTENVLSAYQGKVLKEITDAKQATLVSGTNIKTINGQTLLGSGNLVIDGGGGGTATTIDWSGVTNTPTTISGYGITDAASLDNVVTISGTQTVSGSKTFSQNIKGSQDIICYGATAITPSGLSVIDNLTSSSATDALSANQGRIINGLVSAKQATLVSGTNIKTVNGQSLLGSGNITIDTSISELTWSAITNTPTTLSGYGITDAWTTGECDERYVNVASAQTVTGAKTFSQNIKGNQDIICYGASAVTPQGISVIDNLTSTSATDALSANQGRIINGLVSGKQATLVSGSNIKTINGLSLLGSGNIVIDGGGGGASYTAGENIGISNNVISVTGLSTVATSGSYNDLTNTPSSLPASDVYSWAKAATKPTYTASEVGALASDGTAVNSEKIDGYHIVVSSSAGSSSDTIYFLI